MQDDDALLGPEDRYEYTLRDVRRRELAAYRAGVAAERERSSVLTDDMLRYAMAALGAGNPQEAARFRAFWLHAMTARYTKA
jgi:hypothetical protein